MYADGNIYINIWMHRYLLLNGLVTELSLDKFCFDVTWFDCTRYELLVLRSTTVPVALAKNKFQYLYWYKNLFSFL